LRVEFFLFFDPGYCLRYCSSVRPWAFSLQPLVREHFSFPDLLVCDTSDFLTYLFAVLYADWIFGHPFFNIPNCPDCAFTSPFPRVAVPTVIFAVRYDYGFLFAELFYLFLRSFSSCCLFPLQMSLSPLVEVPEIVSFPTIQVTAIVFRHVADFVFEKSLVEFLLCLAGTRDWFDYRSYSPIELTALNDLFFLRRLRRRSFIFDVLVSCDRGDPPLESRSFLTFRCYLCFYLNRTHPFCTPSKPPPCVTSNFFCFPFPSGGVARYNACANWCIFRMPLGGWIIIFFNNHLRSLSRSSCF